MDDVLQLLLNDYDHERPIDSRQVPCRPEPVMVRQLLEKLQMLLFPRYFGKYADCGSWESYISMLVSEVCWRLEQLTEPLMAENPAKAFLTGIPTIRAVLQQDLQAHLESHTRAELETAQCLTGPHKDDFEVSLSGINLKAYGSQGQTRTAAISLKLAQRELMGRESGEIPVLLLDDVLSELDPGRQDFVLNQISQGQVFITCCEPGRFTKLGRTIEIESGTIKK